MGVMPTLSQVVNWDIEHLNEAAKHWTTTANVWEDRFTQYAVQILNPGGSPWLGEAAEAAQQRAYSDKMIVIGLSDQLHDASAIAKAGAMELAEAKRLVLRTVEAARSAGFTVGEDFSVTDHHVYNRAAGAMRQAQAEAFAADLRATVADLVAADDRIAANLISATAGLGKDHFAESGESTAEQLMRNAAGGTPPAKPPADPLMAALASTPRSAADGAGVPAGGASSGSSFGDYTMTDVFPSIEDWAWSGVGTGVAAKTDIPGAFIEASMKGVAKGEPGHWAKTAFSESSWKFLKIRPASGVLAAPLLLWNIKHDMMDDPAVSIYQATAKEGGGFLAGAFAGAAAGTLVAGPVGTVVGLGAGLLAGAFASNAIDKAWEPAADAVGKVLSFFGG